MRELLKARLEAAGVAAEAEQVEKLAAFHSLLTGANARMNLTRVSADPAEAIDRNYLDSPRPASPSHRREDVRGRGAAARASPACRWPSFCRIRHFVLMDSLLKRVEFLRGVIKELSLNAEAVCLRAEEAGRGDMRERFDAATARAVAPLNVLCELLLPLVRVGGKAVALKGPGAGAGRRRKRRKTRWKRWAGSFSPSRKSPSPGATGRTRWPCLQRPRPPRKSTPGAWACRKSARCDGAGDARVDVVTPPMSQTVRRRSPCRKTAPQGARGDVARHLPCRKAVPVTRAAVPSPKKRPRRARAAMSPDISLVAKLSP